VNTFTRTVLGSAIAALLASPAFAAESLRVVQPPLLPVKGTPVQLDQPTDRLIVKFRDTTMSTIQREGAMARVAADWGLQAKSLRQMSVGADVVKLSRRLDRVEADAFLAQLRADPTVEYAVVDAIKKPAYTPNDTFYASHQWHYFDPVGGMRLPPAWDKSKGAGVVVAVLDTGITAHPDLDANVVAGYDFISDLDVAGDGNLRDSNPADPGDFTTTDQCGAETPAENSSWHGTHVAGTVAAVTNNATGVAGSAPLAKVMPVRVLGRCGGYTSDIADAITWASGGAVAGVPANANPAEVINMSLGGGGACDPATQTAINGAVSRGTVVVVAAGNSNSTVGDFSPASCDKVITVASNDQDGGRSDFSNAGVGIDVSGAGGSGGPQDGITSTGNAGTTVPGAPDYLIMQGTSMASPHVAGIVALMQSIDPQTPAQVEADLKVTAIPMLGATCPGTCGAGKVDALRAVNAASGVVYNPKPTTLRNGVKHLIPTGTLGSSTRFQLVTFSDLTNLAFDLSGGTGNADLYVKLGSAPTTSDYDCRSISLTNAESCVIPSAANGVYHVLVRGKTAFTDVSVRGKYNTSLFTNKDDLAIPDQGDYVTSKILVHGHAGNAPSDLKVSVAIYHSWVGDLEFDLVAPDGTVYPLQANLGGDGDQIVADFFVNASAELANGTWKLRLKDEGYVDTGHVDQWTLRF
jgi:serine protease